MTSDTKTLARLRRAFCPTAGVAATLGTVLIAAGAFGLGNWHNRFLVIGMGMLILPPAVIHLFSENNSEQTSAIIEDKTAAVGAILAAVTIIAGLGLVLVVPCGAGFPVGMSLVAGSPVEAFLWAAVLGTLGLFSLGGFLLFAPQEGNFSAAVLHRSLAYATATATLGVPVVLCYALLGLLA